MRRMLLAGEVMDVLYYTHMLARNTLMASGDLTVEEYLLLLDASVQDVATPKETARDLSVEYASFASAGALLEEADFLTRTRSPHDRRNVGYMATAEGKREAFILNKLLRTVACDFWRTDEAGVEELVRAVEPFQRSDRKEWPESSDAPVTLRSLMALVGLWREYRSFAGKCLLTVSELHMLMITWQFGPQPDHPLYRDRNMFASNDYAANVMLAREKGLMREEDGCFALSERGVARVRECLAGCDPGTARKDEGMNDGPLPRLHALCQRMTAHAMANGIDLYRGTVE